MKSKAGSPRRVGHARVPVTVRLPLNVVKQIDEELDQRIVPLSRTPSYTIADEVEERQLNAQIGEGFVQTFEDSICAMPLVCFLWHKSLVLSAG